MNPCYQCKNRKVGCHSSCSEYLDWQENRLKELKKAKNHLYKGAEADRFRHEEYKKALKRTGKW